MDNSAFGNLYNSFVGHDSPTHRRFTENKVHYCKTADLPARRRADIFNLGLPFIELLSLDRLDEVSISTMRKYLSLYKAEVTGKSLPKIRPDLLDLFRLWLGQVSPSNETKIALPSNCASKFESENLIASRSVTMRNQFASFVERHTRYSYNFGADFLMNNNKMGCISVPCSSFSNNENIEPSESYESEKKNEIKSLKDEEKKGNPEVEAQTEYKDMECQYFM